MTKGSASVAFLGWLAGWVWEGMGWGLRDSFVTNEVEAGLSPSITFRVWADTEAEAASRMGVSPVNTHTYSCSRSYNDCSVLLRCLPGFACR